MVRPDSIPAQLRVSVSVGATPARCMSIVSYLTFIIPAQTIVPYGVVCFIIHTTHFNSSNSFRRLVHKELQKPITTC